MLEENEKQSEYQYPRVVRNTARNRRRPTEHGGARRDARREGAGPGLTGLQAVVCILILIAAVAVQLAGAGTFASAKKFVAAALTTNITQKQFTQAIGQLKVLIPDAKSVFTPSGGTSSAKSSAALGAGASGAASKASSAASSGSSAARSSAPGASSSASSAVSNIVIGEDSVSGGAGGEDLEANTAQDGTLLPPAGASLGPVRLSIRPAWPVTGRITSRFGYRVNPITNKFSFHTGVDIAAAQGTPIGVSMPGTVEDAGVSAAYGNYILIGHGGGIETFYGHCESILKKKGDVVKTGEEIATVGTTGYSTGYHLHFEIRVGGVRYDPLWLLK
jgi:murein DD-endopeptidase MepM/ murein hydrolase activator NlpD